MPFIPRQVKPPARLAITCKLPEETATLLKRYARVPGQHPGVRRQRDAVRRLSPRQGVSSVAGVEPGRATRRTRSQSRRPLAARRAATAMSFEVILPFLRPIAHLIRDPQITEVMVNGSGRIFVERERSARSRRRT